MFTFLLVVQNVLPDRIPYVEANKGIHTTLSALGYSLRPAILLLYIMLVSPERQCMPEKLLVAANALLYFSAYFWPVTFWWSDDMHWRSGPLRNACLFVSLFLMAELIWISVRKFRDEPGREFLLLLFSVIVIIAAVLLDYNAGGKNQTVSFLTIGIVIGDLFFCMWLHLQFVREHEKDLQAEQRIRIMMSQIQPHFLFNTLTTIRALCRSDPQKAEQVTTLFSNYLRQNLDSLETQEMIPLEKELEHVKIYAEIEMTRFPNIRVEYDIRERRRAKCSVRRTAPSSWNRKIKRGTEGRIRAFPPFLFSESLPFPGRDAYLTMTQDRMRTGGSLRKRTKSKILKGENKQ